MLGNVLLLDLSGDSVPCVYLPLLAELGLVSSYAWGAAILARLYRSLCHGARRASRQMAGPLLLLAFWILERFPDFRPFYTRRVQLPGVRTDIPDTLPPRGFHWSTRHDSKPVAFTLTEVRGLIDNMQEGHVIWMPYTPEIRGLMPPRVHVGAERWLYVGPLIDFAIVEMHYPDRVMRQFGLYQNPNLANTRSTWPELHDITRQKYPNCDWLVKHHDWIELWTERKTVNESREFDIGMWDTYLQMYNLSTISTFQSRVDLNFAPSRATQVRQRGESGIKQLLGKVLSFAKKAARKMKKGVDAKFATDAFKLCRDVHVAHDALPTFERALGHVEIPGESEEESEDEESEEEEEEEEIVQLRDDTPMNEALGKFRERVRARNPKRPRASQSQAIVEIGAEATRKKGVTYKRYASQGSQSKGKEKM